MHKQTICKVLNIFQHGKYLVAYALKGDWGHTHGHFHLKIGKIECIYSPVKRFTAVYLYIPVVVLSPL